VWGGNLKLARKTAQLGSDPNTDTIVGGNVLSMDDDYFIGPRVIKQMNESSDAIILAAPVYDSNEERYKFRENLMFEWGYLKNRLPNNNLFVYIIGADRNCLPSDLQGAFIEVVPNHLSSDASIASWIVKNFRKKPHFAEFSAFDLLLDWPSWQRIFERQVSMDDAPRPELFGRALISALPPVLYSENLDWYGKIIAELGPSAGNGNPYVRLSQSLYEYSSKVRGSSEFSPGYFTNLKRQFSHISGNSDKFLASVASNFMGLCMRHEAELVRQRRVDFRRYTEYAIKHFEKSISGFDSIEIDNRTLSLWKAYGYSNLSRAYSMKGDLENSINYIDKSINERLFVLDNLSTSRSTRIHNSYLAEYYIVRAWRCLLVGRRDAEFRDAVKEIKRRKEYCGGYVWEMLEREIKRVNSAIKRK
jgi:tetratricopeptide (TPR) repeat protein